MDPTPAPQVVDDEAEQRFNATMDGTPAGSLQYAIKYGRLALIHTEVLPEFEGKGVGSSLVRFAHRRGPPSRPARDPDLSVRALLRRVAPRDARHRHRDALRSTVHDEVGAHRAEALDVDLARLERPALVEERGSRCGNLDPARHARGFHPRGEVHRLAPQVE